MYEEVNTRDVRVFLFEYVLAMVCCSRYLSVSASAWAEYYDIVDVS